MIDSAGSDRRSARLTAAPVSPAPTTRIEGEGMAIGMAIGMAMRWWLIPQYIRTPCVHNAKPAAQGSSECKKRNKKAPKRGMVSTDLKRSVAQCLPLTTP